MISHTALKPRWIRTAALVLGFALLFWVSVEDTNKRNALLFAATISGLMATRFLSTYPGNDHSAWIRHSLVGLLAGAAVTPVAFALMAFKSGLHSHGFAEYTADQVRSIIWITPVWAVSGLLLGLGTGLWRITQSKE